LCRQKPYRGSLPNIDKDVGEKEDSCKPLSSTGGKK
jgi:hypothetical protein